MAANVMEGVVQAFEIIKEEEIAAPIEIVFETILEQMGPLNSTPEKPMPMVLEAWPGGRWYRDLGNNTGHFWGTVNASGTPLLLLRGARRDLLLDRRLVARVAALSRQ